MRFIRPDGKEESVSTIADYLAAVSAGALKADSLVFDEDTKSWVRAETTREFRSLQAGRSIESAKQESRRASHIRWASLAIIFAGLIAAFFAEPLFRLSSFDAGRRAGQGLTVLALVALVGYAAFRKSSNLSKAYVSLAASTLFFAWMVVGLLAGAEQSRTNEEIRVAAAKALEQIEHEQRKAASLQQLQPSAAAPPPQSPALPPSDAEANLTLAQFMARLLSTRAEVARAVQAFQREAEALNLESVLSPERLVSQSGIAEGRRKLGAFEALITKHARFLRAKQEESRLMATSVKMSPSESDSFWMSFNKSQSRNAKLQRDMEQTQRGLVAASRDLLNLAEKNLGQIQLSNGQLLFRNQETLDTYNSLIQRVVATAEDEERIGKLAAAVEAEAEENLRQFAQPQR